VLELGDLRAEALLRLLGRTLVLGRTPVPGLGDLQPAPRLVARGEELGDGSELPFGLLQLASQSVELPAIDLRLGELAPQPPDGLSVLCGHRATLPQAPVRHHGRVRELCFVVAPASARHPVAALVDALGDELEQAGVTCELSREGFPPPHDGVAYVVTGSHANLELTPAALARTVVLVADPPGTAQFDDALALARAGAAAVVAVDQVAVRELRLLGVDAHHVAPGWTRTWATGEDGGERDIDVLGVGTLTPRRAQAWARYGEPLARCRTQLRLSDGPEDGDPLALLARARVLLDVHADDGASFPALLAAQAICRGAVVVAEHSAGIGPAALGRGRRHHGALLPGEHLLTGRMATLGHLAQALLEDESRRTEMVGAAQSVLRDEMPLSAGAQLLAELASRAARRPAGAVSGDVPAPSPSSPADAHDGTFPSPVTDPEASVVRAALKELRLDLLQVRRDVRRLQLEHGGAPVPEVEDVAQSEAYAEARPRVSVLTALFNHAAYIGDMLTSCAGTGFCGFELVIVDDGSSDGSAEEVQRWLDAHPDVPVVLVRHPVNRGLGEARNTALARARGELAFVLDSDNEVLPPCLERLVAALDAEPERAFAYPVLAMHDAGEPLGLRSALDWAPERLRRGNFVDAMALWRTDVLRDLGGYTTDRRLHGWEDYDLWCRAAERGLSGVRVAQVLARYRVSRHSMLSLTDLSWRTAVSVLVDRYPRLMAGVQPPL
jgi:hypothetical protein